MKMKKFLALVLSAVMAVSMLAACGGGGGSLSISDVNSILRELDSDARVTSSANLNSATRATANYLEEMGTFTNEAATSRLNAICGYPQETTSDNYYSLTVGSAVVATEAEIKSAGYDSMEEAIADAVLALEDAFDTTLKPLAVVAGATYDVDYHASATKAVSENKTEYWVMTVVMKVEMRR